MKNFTRLLTTAAFLFGVLGGVSSAKAETVKLSSKGLSETGKGGNVSYSQGVLSWTSTSDNVYTAISFDEGVLSYFSKVKLSCSGLTEGASFRVIVETKNAEDATVRFIKKVTTTGVGIEIPLNEFIQQWGANTMTEDHIAKATMIRIGGGDDGTPSAENPYSLTIDPTTISLETSWEAPMQIGTSADWNGFSLLVKNGIPSLNATMTADVNAGSKMVGSEDADKRYKGTFDGAGHTLTFIYNNATAEKVAPFQAVEGATIKNLNTTGSITSSGNLPAGIAGQIYGTTTIENCSSDMALSTTATYNGRVGGLVSRCKEGDAALNLTNCLFNGTLSTATEGAMISGLIGYADGERVTLSSCFVNPTSITGTGDQRICHGIKSASNCWYNSLLTTGYWGSEATSAKIASGEVAYDLQNTQETLYWGQDMKAASSSPMLTNNTAYKVFDLGGGEYANMTNTIGNAEDWLLFSKLVAAGQTNINVTMTADVNAGSRMVGDDSHKYSGTFNGAGHTLTFNYDGDGSLIAPFKEVDGATIVDLKTTGSIKSSNNLLAGIVGQVNGATSLVRCVSDMSITTTVGSNGRIGGLVARNANAGSSLSFEHCMYSGAISSSTGQAAGFVGWSPNATTISNCLVTSTDVTGGERTFSSYTFTVPEGKYAYCIKKFANGEDNSPVTLLTDQLRYSGQAAYNLNQGIGDGAWFFGQGRLNTSNVDPIPTLTSDASKKVWGKTPEYTGTMVYMNAGGAVPNAVRLKALGWYFDGTESNVTTTVPADINDATVLRRTKQYFKLSVGAAGATTLVVPFTTTSLPEGVKAYNLTFDGTAITATSVDHLTADKPVLINASEGEYLFSAVATGMEGMTIVDNWIQYTANPTNGNLTGVYNCLGGDYFAVSYVPQNAYVLQNGAEGLGFYKVNDENTIKITSFRAYLTAEGAGSRLAINYVDNDDTAIKDVKGMKGENGAIYNISGQRVEKATSGLFIKNGKKVIIK